VERLPVRRITGRELGRLIGLARVHRLNRVPPWKEDDGRGVIEWPGGRWECDLDREYALVGLLQHHHPPIPQWRCFLLEEGPDGFRRADTPYVDVLVRDYDALEEVK
jgi:hypothetical protein